MKTAIATTSTAIRINHRAQTIELTKAFAKDAERFGSKSTKNSMKPAMSSPPMTLLFFARKQKTATKVLVSIT